jgi:AAA-like domain
MRLRASEYGIKLIRNALKDKEWKMRDWKPLLEASRVLEPNRDWQKPLDYQELEDLPYPARYRTWRRFLEGKERIEERFFKAFCEILGLKWQDVCQVDGAFDIHREPHESICERRILEPASFLRIKGPKQMGKTRMLNRVLKKVQCTLNSDANNRTRIVTINFPKSFNSDSYNSYTEFLRHFCQEISLRLTKKYSETEKNLDNTFQEDWQQRDSKKTNRTINTYFEDKLLDLPLILVLEDIDRVFESPFALDFCILLRAWNADAQHDETWQNLSLVIVHSTDNYAAMSINVSPLAGISKVVVLDEFSQDDVQNLAGQYVRAWDLASTEKIMELVGGNPYFIDLALKTIVDESKTIEEILEKATTEEGIYRDRLRELWGHINSIPSLITSLTEIITKSHSICIDSFTLYQLESLGLIKFEGNNPILRYELYRQYFKYKLTTVTNS